MDNGTKMTLTTQHPSTSASIFLRLFSIPLSLLLTWSICKQSRTSLVGDNYLLFLQPKCFIQGRYCTEKLDADRSKGLQG